MTFLNHPPTYITRETLLQALEESFQKKDPTILEDIRVRIKRSYKLRRKLIKEHSNLCRDLDTCIDYGTKDAINRIRASIISLEDKIYAIESNIGIKTTV